MIDNIEIIKPLLTFNSEDDYYFLQIIQRKKDVKSTDIRLQGSCNSARLIKGYYITSLEHLEKNYYEIKELCNLFNARAGICLNKRSFKSTSLQMMVQLAQSIQANNFKNQGSWNNISGIYHPIKDKTWIIDMDKENLFDEKSISEIINLCEPKGDKIISKIPSKNGFHFITKPFNIDTFKKFYLKDLDIHKNNPTNLYIP